MRRDRERLLDIKEAIGDPFPVVFERRRGLAVTQLFGDVEQRNAL